MKKIIIGLICFASFEGNAANLETVAGDLTSCLFSYVDGHNNISKSSKEISEDAFTHCSDRIEEYRVSIGPNESQWEKLDVRQKQIIDKQRDIAVSKFKESAFRHIDAYINEKHESR